MQPGNREHVPHVAMHIPRTSLHLGRPSRVQRYISSMHRAMEEDSLMIRHDDDDSGHLIDYIITRKDRSGVSNLYQYVSDFISDHRALHVSLTCSRVHPERKQIEVRSLKRIQYDVLEADLIGMNIDRECTDVNLVVRQYDASLSSLLDKHAPSKRIYVVERPMHDWMTFWY